MVTERILQPLLVLCFYMDVGMYTDIVQGSPKTALFFVWSILLVWFKNVDSLRFAAHLFLKVGGLGKRKGHIFLIHPTRQSINLNLKFNPLRQRDIFSPMNRIRLSSHIMFPRIRPGFAPAARVFLTTKRAANFSA
jgi:hypothetical protein